MKELTENQLSSEEIFDGLVLHVFNDTVSLPDGRTAPREVIRHIGAVCIAPLTEDGQLIVERQYRYAIGQTVTEIPAGKLDHEGEDRLAAAQRELKEETGYIAERWTDIGLYYPAPAYSDEKITMYLAEGLHPGERHLDDDEFLEVDLVPVEDLVDQIADGTITDGKTQVAVLKVAEILRRRAEGKESVISDETGKSYAKNVSLARSAAPAAVSRAVERFFDELDNEENTADKQSISDHESGDNGIANTSASFNIIRVEQEETAMNDVENVPAAVSNAVFTASTDEASAAAYFSSASPSMEPGSIEPEKRGFFARLRSKTDIDKAKKVFMISIAAGIVLLLAGGVLNIPIIALPGFLCLVFGVLVDLICCRCPHCGKYLNKRASGRECPYCGQYLRPDHSRGK